MTGADLFVRSLLAGTLNTLWIALALAAVVWAIGAFLPRTNAATRHLLWWLALAFVVILPFSGLQRRPAQRTISIPRYSLPALAPMIQGHAVPHLPSKLPVPRLGLPVGKWPRLLVALWVVFALVQFGRIAASSLHVEAIKLRARAAPAPLNARFAGWLRACGIGRPVRLLVSDGITCPIAAGFVSPAVILPAALLDEFDEQALDHVFLHELAHLGRYDDWTNLAACSLTALIGWHPVAAWILRQIGRERELAADDWVVARTGEARPYAATLARLFEACRARRAMILAAGMAGSGSHLGDRIEVLLASGRQFTTRASAARIVPAALALLVMAVAGVRAPHFVVLAQSTNPAPAPISKARQILRPIAPAGSHPSFLAALVAAGYGDLSVEQIISLKDHGVTGEFLAGLQQCGWERVSAEELIELVSHGVTPQFLAALREYGFTHVETTDVIGAFSSGVTPQSLRSAAQYSTRLTLAQIVKLKEAGVI